MEATEEKKFCLRDTIIPKSDQLNYDDVVTGPLAVRVTGLKIGTAEQPVIVEVCDGATGAKLRDWKPCKTVRRILIAAWGDKGRDWIGKRATLVADPNVRFGGEVIGGIRVSHLSGIRAPLKLKLTTARGKRTETTIEVMQEGSAQ